jgi:hypothetical protein
LIQNGIEYELRNYRREGEKISCLQFRKVDRDGLEMRKSDTNFHPEEP